MKRIKLLSLALILLFFQSACKKDDSISPILPTDIEGNPEMDEAMQNILNHTEVPGFAIAMLKDGEIIYKNAFGYANIIEKLPFTISTQMNIASMSKTFVGAATVRAIEMGLFNTNTPINELLDFEVRHPFYPESPILIRHLYTHTSGIIDQPDLYFRENYAVIQEENMNEEGAQLLKTALNIEQRSQRPMRYFLFNYLNENGSFYGEANFSDSKPGTQWSYSNLSAGLMALIIEQQSGLSFADFVKNEVFNPLNMTSSTYRFEDVDQNQLARFYLNKQTEFPYYTNDSYAEGGVYSNISDLSLYLTDISKAANGEAGKLFPYDYYQLLLKDQLNEGIVPDDFADNHGVFWIKKDGKLMHGGNSFGVTTYMEINPATKLGYVLLTNLDAVFESTQFEAFYKLIREAIDKYHSKKII